MTDEAVDLFPNPAAGPARAPWWQTEAIQRFLREPLLHFLVLGALLFAVNAVVAPDVPKERLIEFTPEIRKSLIDTFTQTQKRQPSAAEIKRLTDDWLLNEIVYREALVQGFDKGDEMIRDRINQKMRLLIFSNLAPDTPKEADLKKWLDAHRDQYDIPERVSFFDLPMGKSQTEAQATLKLINAGKEPESVRLLARTYENRPMTSLSPGFSKPFAAALRDQPLHKWQIMQSGDSWHIVRVEAVLPKHAVTVAEAAGPLVDEWQADSMRKKAQQAVRTMAKSYVIKGTALP
ncbi:MAG TPA: peptidylprolyl isomerase [Rhizomicrobium sp.]|nr:peptidylprolyl isomerase [Rhizomicrobium sp.]